MIMPHAAADVSIPDSIPLGNGPPRGERPASLQRLAIDLPGYFGRSVEATVERTRDDHGFSLAIPADDARVL